MPYASKLRFGAQNVQGMADTLKLKNLILMMQEHNLSVLFLSETKATAYYSYLSEQHLVILSGNHIDKHAGVGAIIHPKLRPHLADVVQVSNRILHITLNKKGGRVHLIGVYAPHSGLDEEVRQHFWDTLEEYSSKLPQPEPVYITGDFNVRFQAQHPNDYGVAGPFTYGKGRSFIDHTPSSNRSLCIRAMNILDMVEVASYKTPQKAQHITFRDKSAPPSDWSQYLLDPIIMQQFYDKLHHEFRDHSLEVASQIRSFLPLPAPLPPPKLEPSPDPYRFQRLDHTFTRAQWLSSVNSCKSKLYTGFPSDHYLLVTEVQVKLAKRDPPSLQPFKLDFSKITPTDRLRFNQLVASECYPETPEPLSDHTAKITFYTDGSGTKGRCSASTPAGWGWCTKQGDEWLTAHGPVVTDHSKFSYLGARVGSNNTGELSAIIEALLYAVEHEYSMVHVNSDSQWAINVITGKWRAKVNKDLVKLAQHLSKKCGMTVEYQWVKAHVGLEGNEVADRLAEAGKKRWEAEGGRNIPPPRVGTSTQDPQTTPQTYVTTLKAAAFAAFPPMERRHNKPWLTDNTLRSLAEARAALANNEEDWKTKRNQAKRLARRGRVNWVHDQILADPSAEHSTVWKVVRRQKKGFQGKRTHLFVHGRPVPWSKTHEAFRDHLQNQQWKRPHIPDHAAQDRKDRHPLRPQQPDEPPFTHEELTSVLHNLKRNKSPGPDGLVNEVVTLLDEKGEKELLALYNQCWHSRKVPDEWCEAIVVSIFKNKGKDTDPENYRPISLLNVVYKIYASRLQKRIASSMDGKLRHTQFGFRAARGTRHPLFTLRRAMEWSVMTNHNLQLLFLDWKQAFDSLDHTAMLEALARFGISSQMLAAIGSIYSNPTFRTKGPDDSIAKGQVHAGIRQGCPLSPYLFVIVLTVIFHDVDSELAKLGTPTNTWSEGYPVYDLEYADDTLIFALTTPQLQSMLTTLETVAMEYGMRLNQVKTEMLHRPDHPTPAIFFQDGKLVPRKDTVKYLGSMISWNRPFDTSYKHRTALAEEAYKKLRLIWNSSLNDKAKLRIFQSIFIPVLIYGMDSLTLTTPQLARLDAYYFRFLRRIVGIKASFYSRVSNHTVWERASYPDRPSDYLWRSQYKFMQEVFAANREDPYHSVVFGSAYKDRILSQGRRRGMQFPYWLEVSAKRYFPTFSTKTTPH